MEFTCLSRGGFFYFPPCHMLEVCGFRIQFDCPMDFSALPIFSPVPLDFDVISDEELSTHPGNGSFNLENVSEEKIEKPLDVGSLIKAEPWYKIIKNLRLWNLSFTDIVLISSPMGMLGLPFLTRQKGFSAKIYATEATARLGKMMMDDLVAMHMEFKQFYGSEDDATPQWMRQEELELLHHALKEVAFGQDEADLGGWMPMYSAADVKDCMKKVETVRYGEEACYNGALVIKALSCGLEIGACNWTINGPKRDIAYISSSIFSSSNAMNFDYLALQGETIIYSDFSSVESMNDILNDTSGSLTENLMALSRNEETLANLLSDPAESVGESEKLSFICSCAIQSVESGGSVLIPINRLGVTLQLLEQISASLDCSNLKNKLAGTMCCILSSLELTTWSGGPFASTLVRGSQLVTCSRGTYNMQKGLDAELALLPFRPMSMKVLQCAFLSGIKLDKVRPLLKVLQPKVVMLPENLSRLINTNTESCTVFSYSEGETLRVPNLKDSLELEIAPDLAMSFCWRKLQQGNIDIARLKGELSLNCGKFKLFPENAHVATDQRPLIHWGQPDLKKLLNVLSKMGIEGSLQQSDAESSNVGVIRIHDPTEAVIEIQDSRTIISVADKTLCARIFDAVDSILNGV
ncbi:integrator complex subunit 9 homolog isoform X4 [Cucurbita maxima]|uniref:Integrator complex subunit 9 homolog isoform X4 n=1 Tax=Cucurbita maxima TaxID=3661 RepID=A0A6J1JQB9_CUCMA|nr:integrator complex subunit 9 homolog isoform X4 [Cucurbita maxima]